MATANQRKRQTKRRAQHRAATHGTYREFDAGGPGMNKVYPAGCVDGGSFIKEQPRQPNRATQRYKEMREFFSTMDIPFIITPCAVDDPEALQHAMFDIPVKSHDTEVDIVLGISPAVPGKDDCVVQVLKRRTEESGELTYVLDSSLRFGQVGLIVKERIPEPPYKWVGGFNHHPAYPGIWVKYNLWRLKEFYDIRLHDGTEIKHAYPNGSGWHHDEGRTDDCEVAEVRLIPNSENPWHLHSELPQSSTVKRAIGMFGEHRFPVVNDDNGEITFTVRYHRAFREPVGETSGMGIYSLAEGVQTKEEAANGDTESCKYPG